MTIATIAIAAPAGADRVRLRYERTAWRARPLGNLDDPHSRSDRQLNFPCCFMKISINHVSHSRLGGDDDGPGWGRLEGAARSHRERGSNTPEVLDELERGSKDAEEVEGVGMLVPAVKGAEGEPDLIDRAGSDGEVVALFPPGAVIQDDGASEGSRHAPNHLPPNEGASDASSQRLGRHER